MSVSGKQMVKLLSLFTQKILERVLKGKFSRKQVYNDYVSSPHLERIEYFIQRRIPGSSGMFLFG